MFRKVCPLAYAIEGESEALGQLGQDEPASGMALEPLDGLCPISGSVAIALHHRNSDPQYLQDLVLQFFK